MSRTPDLEAQNLEKNKNNTVRNFSRVVLLQTIKVSIHGCLRYFTGKCIAITKGELYIRSLWLNTGYTGVSKCLDCRSRCQTQQK